MSPIRTAADEEEDVEVVICRLSEEWTGLWNSGQLDKVADLYATDALYLPAHANPIHGRKNIREFLREPMSQGATDFTLRIDFIQRAGNLAYDVGHYSILLPQKDGSKKMDQGRYLVVWQHQQSGGGGACRCSPPSPAKSPGSRRSLAASFEGRGSGRDCAAMVCAAAGRASFARPGVRSRAAYLPFLPALEGLAAPARSSSRISVSRAAISISPHIW